MPTFRASSGSFKALQVTGSNLTVISSSVYINNLTTTSQLNILTYNSESGQLYYTASSAIGGGGGGDITDITAGNGLSGGGSSGNVTVTLDTSSTHFVSGVSKLTGSLLTTSSFNTWTGSNTSQFAGTSSYVSGSVFTSTNPALSASFALSSSRAITASLALTASFVATASYVTGSIFTSTNPALSASYSATASFVITAQTASYVTGSIFTNTNPALSASYAATASFVTTASYVTGSIFTSTNPALSASYALSSSNALTASFVVTASYVTGSIFTSANPALSASYALTASHALNIAAAVDTSSLLKTASVSLNTITFIKGDNISQFSITVDTGSGGGNTFPFNGNAVITGSLLVSGSNSGFSGITGSFTGSLTGSLFGTASWAQSASQAITASYVLQAVSASFASTSSYVVTAQTASYITGSVFTSTNPALSASYALSSSNTLTASFVATASYVTGSIFTSTNPALSASYALSSSNALTASFINIPQGLGITVNNGTLLTASLRTVNGITPVDGNVVVSLGGVSTGLSSSLSSSFPFIDPSYPNPPISGTLFVISGETGGNIDKNGDAYIFITSSTQTGQWQQIYGFDTAAGDARYARIDIATVQNLTASFASTASFITSSNVRGPFGFNSILSASYASGSTSASYALSSSYALTASFVATASYVSGSVFNSTNPALSASYASGSTSASYAGTASVLLNPYPINVTGSPYSTLYSVEPPSFQNGNPVNTDYSIFFGINTGFSAGIGGTAKYVVAIGAGAGANNAGGNINYSNYIGASAGDSSPYASQSNFIGVLTGYYAYYARNSNFIGYQAGAYQSPDFSFTNIPNGAYSNYIGHQAGIGYNDATFFTYRSPGINNTVIGTNISLPNDTSNYVNLGGAFFISGTYSNTASVTPAFGYSSNILTSSVNTAKVGINLWNPSYSLHVSGTVGFPNLTDSNTATKVVLLDNNGQLFTTASNAIGGGGSSTPAFPFNGNAVITGSLLVSGSGVTITGSLNVTDSTTLTGTSSISGVALIGSSSVQALYTTARTTIVSGLNTIYSVPTSSYNGGFFDYIILSGANARAGQIVSIWSGSEVKYIETTTTDIGSTSNFIFSVALTAGSASLQVTGSTGAVIKTIIKSI